MFFFVRFPMEDGKQWRFALGPDVEQSLGGQSDTTDSERQMWGRRDGLTSKDSSQPSLTT